jgi:hypothetical protein
VKEVIVARFRINFELIVEHFMINRAGSDRGIF